MEDFVMNKLEIIPKKARGKNGYRILSIRVR